MVEIINALIVLKNIISGIIKLQQMVEFQEVSIQIAIIMDFILMNLKVEKNVVNA